MYLVDATFHFVDAKCKMWWHILHGLSCIFDVEEDGVAQLFAICFFVGGELFAKLFGIFCPLSVVCSGHIGQQSVARCITKQLCVKDIASFVLWVISRYTGNVTRTFFLNVVDHGVEKQRYVVFGQHLV